MTHLAVLVGSLRRESLSRRLAHALLAVAPDGVTGTEVPIGDLALYNPDIDGDGNAPAPYTAFRTAIRAADAVLFVTPEYNRGVPGALKNAIDVGSRPYGASAWAKKPAAVVSCSPGAIGGALANHALRQCLVFLDMPVLQQPEAYVGNVAKVVDEPDPSRAFLTSIMAAFADWIERTRPTGENGHG